MTTFTNKEMAALLDEHIYVLQQQVNLLRAAPDAMTLQINAKYAELHIVKPINQATYALQHLRTAV